MGVIQNSLNSMLATLMGGAIGMKHIAGQKEQQAINERNELMNLQGEDFRLTQEINKKDEEMKSLSEDVSKYNEGKYKAYLPDSDTPVWVDKSTNIEEWSNQRDMAIKGLKSSQSNIDDKLNQKSLIQIRIDELNEKHKDYINNKMIERYEPSKEQQKEMKKQEKENIKKGVY